MFSTKKEVDFLNMFHYIHVSGDKRTVIRALPLSATSNSTFRKYTMYFRESYDFILYSYLREFQF